jgi:hypothetical protein
LGCCAKAGAIIAADNKPAADTSAAMALMSAPPQFGDLVVVLFKKVDFAFLLVNRLRTQL